MLKKILTIILLISAVVTAQDEYKPWIKAEREIYANLKKDLTREPLGLSEPVRSREPLELSEP